MTASAKILWADDDHYELATIRHSLEAQGFVVITAGNVREAKELFANDPPDLAILDVMMPTGGDEDHFETKGGFESGVALAKWIKNHYPRVPFIGFSIIFDHEVKSFFEEYGAGYFNKGTISSRQLAKSVKEIVGMSTGPRTLKTFIVHGHDDAAKLELKNYLQNILRLSEPTILHEQASLGRTIIEKFEEESQDTDIVFVLLTPDDVGASATDSNIQKRRARQNVIFEMGYFLGSFARRSARVILLHKGPIELPSDISGLVYVDISKGIQAAGEDIRREIEHLI